MITSRQNSFIKFVKSLSDKSARDENALFLAEGIKLVKEAFTTGQSVFALLSTEEGRKKLSSVCETNAEREEILSDDLFLYVSGEKNPQGVMAVVKKPVSRAAKSPNRMFLDGVSDPANVGAIIRTAAAAGYNDVYLTEDCADPFSPKSVRASMSGIFRVNVIAGQREELLKNIDLPLIIADMDGEDLFSFKKKDAFCLVIGNEGRGVSSEVKKKAESIVSIPMANGVESLNAAVSAGIAAYQLKNL